MSESSNHLAQDPQSHGQWSAQSGIITEQDTTMTLEDLEFSSDYPLEHHFQVVHDGYVPIGDTCQSFIGSGHEESEAMRWEETDHWDNNNLVFDLSAEEDHPTMLRLSDHEGAQDQEVPEERMTTTSSKSFRSRTKTRATTSKAEGNGRTSSVNTVRSVVPTRVGSESTTDPFAVCPVSYVDPKALAAYAARVYEENKRANHHLPAPSWLTNPDYQTKAENVLCMRDTKDPSKTLINVKAVRDCTSQYRSADPSDPNTIQYLEVQWALEYDRTRLDKGKHVTAKTIDRRSQCRSVCYRAHLWASTYLMEQDMNAGMHQKAELRVGDISRKYDLETICYVSNAFLKPWAGHEVNDKTLSNIPKCEARSEARKRGVTEDNKRKKKSHYS